MISSFVPPYPEFLTYVLQIENKINAFLSWRKMP